MNRTLLIALFIAGMSFQESSAQGLIRNRIFRIIAFKRGNNAVTSMSNHKELIPSLKMYIPNAFTPNGDGLNDRFGVKGEGISGFRMVVFDRWGEVVFESDRPDLQWDGNYRGQPAQQGTYVYQVFADGSENRMRTGSVTLVR